MTYTEAIDYLFTQTPVFQRDGAIAYKPGLDNIKSLDLWFGQPHRNFISIHVGGTNGKGSVSHMIASILQESGYKVGLYTSPHLKDFRERIRINGNMIPEKEVCSFVDIYINERPQEILPSFFEITTMMALNWFSQEKIDIAIIEVGLGGRLDSTNIIKPIASVITNISFDHMALLGDSLDKIAFEKAGIIKSEVPVVIGKANGVVREIFEKTAQNLKSQIHFAEEEFILEEIRNNEINNYRTKSGSLVSYNEINCELKGIYQKENISTVLSLIEVIKTIYLNISFKSFSDGLTKVIENTGLRGRWETISESPKIICDTGHNEAGIKYVVKQLSQTPYKKLHFIIGMVNDKDIRAVLGLLPKEAEYYFTKASIPRAMNEEELKLMATEYGLSGTSWKSVKDALNAAKKCCHQNDLIFVGGSNFIVAEAI